MLEFYEFNTLNICIMLISTFIVYYILSNYFNNNKENDLDNKSKFSLQYLILSVFVSIIISLFVAFLIANKEESILTDNYWDVLQDEIN